MRILVLPRDPNPYQGLLYGEMARLGVRITYIGCLTPSRTLNVMLLPLEVAAHRVVGTRLIHLHWVFAFALPGARRLPALRRVAYVWFLLWLRTCQLLGMHILWTAHNVLPHSPVFADDISARRALVTASDLVVAHSQSALDELATLGAVPRRSAIIWHGPLGPARLTSRPGTHGVKRVARRFLFFGRVHEYKGVDDLLIAFAALPHDVVAHLTVAGQCEDPMLRSRLRALERKAGDRIVLRLERVPDEEVGQILATADVVVLPFKQVTTSGSAILALSHGRPLIIPDLPGLAELPAQAVLRYDGQVPGLTAALAHLARSDDEVLAAMSAAARGYACKATWQEIAQRTLAEMLSVLSDVREG